MIKRSVFNTFALFDKSMKSGGSDLDYFRKLRRGGIEPWFVPGAVVHHVIPAYRVSEEYLTWRSTLTGTNLARIDYRDWGLAKTILACIARIGQAFLINIPLMCWSQISCDDADKLTRKCLLWRAAGFTAQTLYLVSPRLFPQERFLAGLEFRKERAFFSRDHNCAGK